MPSQPTPRKDLVEAARTIVGGPSLNRTKTAGYDIKSGERVLFVAKTTDDPEVTAALAAAMHEAGARIDILTLDIPDRVLEPLDEFRALMKNVPDVENDPDLNVWLRGIRWVESVAEEEGYSLLVQGEAGALPRLTGVRYEGAPWHHRDTFQAAAFPWPLWDLINSRAWAPIWEKGRGGTVHLTDPEGTDLYFDLRAEHWEAGHYEATRSRRRFNADYYLGHLFGYPTPPYSARPPINGIAAGTINHFGLPFPSCKVHIEEGLVTRVEGGGVYGDKWRETLELTRRIKYPEYPDPGLFWVWECAIGTHPKMARPPSAFTLSGHGSMFERLRSGYIHIGIGTANHNPSELWAAEHGQPFGHLHVHLQLPTYTLTTAEGEVVDVIRDGRLMSLEDPEVVNLAEQYGDPGELLTEAWMPGLPGINHEGSYDEYAADPAGWLREHEGGL